MSAPPPATAEVRKAVPVSEMAPEARKEWSAKLLAIRREKKRLREQLASKSPLTTPTPPSAAAAAGPGPSPPSPSPRPGQAPAAREGAEGAKEPAGFSNKDEQFLEALEEQFRQFEKATKEFNGQLYSSTHVGYKIEREIERQFRKLEAKIGLAEELVEMDDDDLDEVFSRVEEKRVSAKRTKKNLVSKDPKRQRHEEQGSDGEDGVQPGGRRKGISEAAQGRHQQEEGAGSEEEAGSDDEAAPQPLPRGGRQQQRYGGNGGGRLQPGAGVSRAAPARLGRGGEREEEEEQGAAERADDGDSDGGQHGLGGDQQQRGRAGARPTILPQGSNTRRTTNRSIASLHHNAPSPGPTQFQRRALQTRPSGGNVSRFADYV